MVIVKMVFFLFGVKVLDLGIGGGFLGILLVIMFLEMEFVFIDGICKKIKVVNEVVEVFGLQNVKGFQQCVEECKGVYFDFVVICVVVLLEKFVFWSMLFIIDE